LFYESFLADIAGATLTSPYIKCQSGRGVPESIKLRGDACVIDHQSAPNICDLAARQCEVLGEFIGGYESIAAAKLRALKSVATEVGMLSKRSSGADSGIDSVVR
jgi:hypothetical protein